MSGTLTDPALVAAATSTSAYVTPTLPITDALLQVPAALSDEMYAKIQGPEVADLTTKIVGGTGVFDTIMASLSAHLRAEYEKDRITGAEYTKAYLETSQMALSGAIQFLLGKEQAFWTAQRAQIDAIAGRVELERGRVALSKGQFEAMAAQFTLAQILPKQRDVLAAEIIGKGLDNDTKTYQLANILPKQSALLLEQIDGASLDNDIKTFNLTSMLPAQRTLIVEQGEAQRAQTSDYRSDSALITGVSGGQKALYAQQVQSYKRDAELKAAKIFADAWTIQKTVDEGLAAPGNFSNATLDLVFDIIRTNNAL